MELGQDMMDRIEQQANFVNGILLSDEGTFCVEGFVNHHNCRYGSLIFWAGLIGRHVPFIIDENLTCYIFLVQWYRIWILNIRFSSVVT